MFPDSTLPLEAGTFSERYVLYLLETSSRFPTLSLGTIVFSCVMWWVTGVWLFAFLAAIAFMQLPQWWQARVLTRMIRRTLKTSETGSLSLGR